MAAGHNWRQLILKNIKPTGKEIGKGAFGRVYEVNYEGMLCAAKELHTILLQYANDQELQKLKIDFLRECLIWSTLRHPCVVQFLGEMIVESTVLCWCFHDVIRSLLSSISSVRATCYGGGENEMQPETTGREVQQYSVKC